MSRDVHRKRFLLLLVYAVMLLPFVGYGAWRAMQSNANSPLDWVPGSFPPRKAYDDFRASFGSGDIVVLGWPGCRVDEPKVDLLARVLRESKAFYDNDGDWYFESVSTGREVLRKLTGSPLNVSENEAVRRLGGTLIGPDGRTTCVVVTFTSNGLKEREQLVGLIQSATTKFCGVTREDQHLAGPVIDGLSVDRAGKQALDQFAIPSAAIVLYLCWWCLKSLRAALLIFGLSVVAQGAALAVVHYSGDTMSALLIVMPPLIQVLAVAGGIHLVNYYLEAARERDGHDPAHRALQMGWLPCVLSAGTTAVGLASLLASRLTPIRAFGGYAAAGVLITVGLLLTFVPGTFAIWPLKLDANDGETSDSTAETEGRGIWLRLTGLISRTHWLITTVALAVMIAAGCGIRHLNTSVRIETLFPSDSRILTDYRWLEEQIGPLVPIEVVLEFDSDCGLSFRQRLALVEDIERGLQQLDEVGATMSAADFMPQLPELSQLPRNMSMPPVERVLNEMRPELVDVRYLEKTNREERLRVTAYTSALNELDYGDFLGVVEQRVDGLLQDENGNHLAGVTADYTGIMPLVHDIQRQLMADLFHSFLWAFVIVAAVMTLVQGGFWSGLTSMVPNLFPIVVIFGVLGWKGLPMDIGSVMTASVALGVAVDDTLHFLTFFRRGIDAGLNRRDAVQFAYRHCGAAMVQTTTVCSLGLLIFAFSKFVPTSHFAWMMLALMTTALVGDLIVLPSLLLGPFGRLFCPTHPKKESTEDKQAADEFAAAMPG